MIGRDAICHVLAAAERLNVNPATVLRRIAQPEQRPGTHMFGNRPPGYRPTDGVHLDPRIRRPEASILPCDQSVPDP